MISNSAILVHRPHFTSASLDFQAETAVRVKGKAELPILFFFFNTYIFTLPRFALSITVYL